MSTSPTLGFLGTGKMATALAQGLLRAQLIPKDQLLGSDPSPAAREGFSQATGGRISANNGELVDAARVLVLAVKPDQVDTVLQEISPGLSGDHLLVSIAAGIPLSRLEQAVPPKVRVVRAMPNTPALVGASATGYALSKTATPEDADHAQRMFAAVGLAFQVPESLLDAVTGLSGSGPAYVYQVIEALSDGGVAAGLPRTIATQLAAQTLLGAARMVLETGLHPAALKDMVTSPGGTTIEGLHELEKGGVRCALMNAVRSATNKARQLNA